MLPSWNRCFRVAGVLLLPCADFKILLQSTPASLSATCVALLASRWLAILAQSTISEVAQFALNNAMVECILL